MSESPAIQQRTIEGRSAGPRLLITAGVHGDEFEPMAAARRLMQAIDPQKLRGQVTLVPVVNEPAFALGQRVGPDGLDLARTCPGRRDGTITELIAFNLSQLILATDYYIDLHTGGQILELLPFAGYALHENGNILATQRRMARAFGLPIIWGTSPRLEGRSLSVARDGGKPAIYVEGRGGPYDAETARWMVEGCLAVMAELQMIDAEVRPRKDVRTFEDPRVDSGHMQVSCPAAAAGFFEPAVRPGDNVGAGGRLGRISDILGENVIEVPAQQAGLVLGIRSFCRVEKGTALAIVLDATHLREST